jgi:hypothetical protein
LKSRRSERALALLALAVVDAGGAAWAGDPPEVAEARQEFVRGSEHAKRAQWAEALQAFEHSAKLRPHSVTTFNIGVCQRAMGNFALARATFQHAVEENRARGGGELADSLVAQDGAFIAEIEALLATAMVTLEPATATVAIDGRPLALLDAPSGEKVAVAGIREPGRGEPAPSGQFRLLVDPGTHVFTFARPGFADALVTRTFAPGATLDVKLSLDRLPAIIHVTATQPNAVVMVNDVDVGVAPVDLSRPAGDYRVVVRSAGYDRYETSVSLQPGQEMTLSAALRKHEVPITAKWWFWTIGGAVVAGAAVGTYALTRQGSTVEEPLNGGGLGWTAKVR